MHPLQVMYSALNLLNGLGVAFRSLICGIIVATLLSVLDQMITANNNHIISPVPGCQCCHKSADHIVVEFLNYIWCSILTGYLLIIGLLYDVIDQWIQVKGRQLTNHEGQNFYAIIHSLSYRNKASGESQVPVEESTFFSKKSWLWHNDNWTMVSLLVCIQLCDNSTDFCSHLSLSLVLLAVM